MYCPQCGAQNDNSAAFCGKCGTNLSDYNRSNTSSTNSVASTANLKFRPTIRYSKNPVLNEIKKLACSPLMLIATLAFSFMIVLSISNAEVIGTKVLGYLRSTMSFAGMYELQSAISVLNGVSKFLAFLVMLPQIIIAIGIWLTIYSAFDKTKDNLSVSGLNAVRVINIITLIMNIILTVAYFCGGMWLISKASESMINVPFSIIFVLVAVFAILVFRIFYVKKTINFIDCIIYSVKEKTPVAPSKFIGVMMFICGGAYAVLALTDSGTQNWLALVTYLCFGISIFSYVGKMCYLRDNYKAILENEPIEEQIGINGNQELNDSVFQSPNSNTSSTNNKKNYIVAVAALAAIIAIVTAMTYTAPGIDKDIVGKWQYGSNEEAVTEFKRNGTFIANAGTEYEEVGTYTAKDGVITVVIDGSINEINYEVIDSDRMKVERSYVTSNWERKYRWETLYRID